MWKILLLSLLVIGIGCSHSPKKSTQAQPRTFKDDDPRYYERDDYERYYDSRYEKDQEFKQYYKK